MHGSLINVGILTVTYPSSPHTVVGGSQQERTEEQMILTLGMEVSESSVEIEACTLADETLEYRNDVWSGNGSLVACIHHCISTTTQHVSFHLVTHSPLTQHTHLPFIVRSSRPTYVPTRKSQYHDTLSLSEEDLCLFRSFDHHHL